MIFDHEIKITPFECGTYLEITIENKLVYKGEFLHYVAAACFAEQYLKEEYQKHKEKV